MNLFMQIVNNQFRGFIKININYEMIDEKPFICIDIENSKFEVKPKDVQRLVKLSKEKIFANIIESRVDLNIKIAKVLSNAMSWEIDFDAFRSGNMSLIIPAQKDPNAAPKPIEQEEEKPKDENDLFNAIEGQREDVEIEQPVKEEEPVEEPQQEEEVELQVAESYPLRQLRPYAEVLLVSFTDVKKTMEEKIGFKCDDCFMEESGISMVKK